MAESTTDLLNATSAAVTGGETPSNVNVAKPTRESVWMLLLAMSMAEVSALVIICALAFRTQWPPEVSGSRIMWLGILALAAQISIPITIIALASSRLGTVKASAGDRTIEIEGRQG